LKSFRFPLQKILEWWRTQLELAESRMKRLNAELQRIDTASAELATTREDAVRRVLQKDSATGEELAALGSYLIHAKKEDLSLRLRREELEQRIAGQHRNLLKARRNLRLLERYRDRRFAEWRTRLNRELESFAAEAYLVQWNARHTGRHADE
jgi:flagellar export protein FliJ